MFKGKKHERENGITLIALVITIIVLLILAAVSIATLTGENGIIRNATNAKDSTQKSEIIEQARVDILTKQTEKLGKTLTADELEQILTPKYGTLSNEENILDRTLTTENGYQIPVKDIWNEELAEEVKTPISKTESYVGYYADIDDNGTVDGIIYADLAVGNTGDGGSGAYTYMVPTVEATNLKDYYIEGTESSEENPFGENSIIAPIEGSEGEERFYIIALRDIGQYSWYSNSENVGNFNTEEGFGKGKTNTSTMVSIWNNDSNKDEENDIWGHIEDGWFVPSLEEWSAIKGELKIDESNYSDKGLSDSYWTSSHYAYIPNFSYSIYLKDGNYGQGNMGLIDYVRLSTTF